MRRFGLYGKKGTYADVLDGPGAESEEIRECEETEKHERYYV